MENFKYFSDNFVNEVKQSLLDQFEKEEAIFENYEREDVEQIKNGNLWFIRRFLVEKPSTTTMVAVKKIEDAMKWRKTFGVNQLSDASFPREVYKIGGVFPYLPDKDGNSVIIFRMRVLKKNPDTSTIVQERELFKKFLIYRLEQLIMGYPYKKIRIVVDFQKASIFNADLHVSKFMIFTLLNYYYEIFATSLLVEMPWLLNQFWIVIRNLIPEEDRKRVQFCTCKNLANYFALDQLPDFLNGTAVASYRKVPEGALTFEKWALKIDFSDKAQIFKEFLDSVDALHNNNNNNSSSSIISTS